MLIRFCKHFIAMWGPSAPDALPSAAALETLEARVFMSASSEDGGNIRHPSIPPGHDVFYVNAHQGRGASSLDGNLAAPPATGQLPSTRSVEPAGGATAAPTIRDADGVFGHNRDVTLTGNGFPFNTQARIIWDDVETGTFNPQWRTTSSLSPNRTDARTPFSQVNAKVNVTGSGTDGFFGAPDDMTSRQLYLDYWVKPANNWDWGTTQFDGANRHLANIKIARFWSASNINENVYVGYAGWANDFISYVENTPGASLSTGGARERLSRGSWHHVQVELTENSAQRVADGALRFWVDGNLLHNRSGLVTREDYPDLKRVSVAGWENAWGPGSGESSDSPNDLFLDDVFVSTTKARVELGDAPTYAASRHRELQPSVAFTSASSLRFKLNQGSFAPGSVVYVYVTNTSGEVNAAGFPIRLVPQTATALFGDANLDGRVNGTDFSILAANFGRSGRTWAQADFTGDAEVTGADFALLAGNFGRRAAAAMAVAPAVTSFHPSATGALAPMPTFGLEPNPEPQTRTRRVAVAAAATPLASETPTPRRISAKARKITPAALRSVDSPRRPALQLVSLATATAEPGGASR
jgi:hypothetical protein